MKRFAVIPKLFLTTSLLYFSVAVGAQHADYKKEDKAVVTKSLVESKHYMFVPQSMTPLSSRTRQLDYGYDLRIISDTVNCYMPYVGKSFVPDYGNDGSIRFKTTNVDYKVQELKNGKGWTVTITPAGVRNVRQITLHVTAEGRTSADVTSNTRDMVTFNGFIQEIH